MLEWAAFVSRHQQRAVGDILNGSRADLERDAAMTLATLARDHAQQLLAENKGAPFADDTYSRAVRRMVTGAMAIKKQRDLAKQNALMDRLFAEQEAVKAKPNE
jgi:hypothetical protein